ncbi:MAG: M48 family metalloprotease [Desulfobacula sp.]|uniref:M48 family metallopeptidase n=1 Tax=Desulfobacula sp. TaxID=2593537 RepID=UPI001ECCD7EF|nr:M48 family metalloprotease [Desulfobacula sp.]MBT4875712.1 M48 family metalloprotease [Desulfobacula sp.]MBT6748374.1 M48 family metalloprotease [Desulfobacula sp.]
MFSNLLYFLIALIIYSTSELFKPVENFDNTLIFNSLLISVLFFIICNITFKRLEKKASQNPYENIDHLINNYISRLSILALMIFAVNIYGFKLSFLFTGIGVFDHFPTLEAIVFLGLFLFYLIIIWNEAYRVQKRYFSGDISKKNFILSNASFSLPALLPWFCLSIIADALGFLPWQPLKKILQTPAGEIGYIALFLIAVTVFGPVLIKRIWNCKPLEQGLPRTMIENACKKADLKYSNILKWELFGGTMITAGVMGLVGRFRYILVTPALINSLNDDELISVILHEIGHVKKHHMLFYLFFFAGFILCNFIFFEPLMLFLYIVEPVYQLFGLAGVEKTTAHSILISLSLVGIFVLYFRFVFGFFMRNFERQADLHVYNFTKDASPLISTFYKIASFSRQSIDTPNWHHYSIGQRVRFLERCQATPALIQAHHLHVRKLVAGYFILLVLLFGIGYSINYGIAKEPFDNFVAEKILFQQIDVDPENSELYALVGDYYYNRKNYGKAIDSYENVLMADPENVHALNNLSWLFSTCPKEEYRNGKKALEYAQRALVQKREAFILDTYAEALFINNDINTAVNVSKEAFNLSKDRKKYYKAQLLRFEELLNP